MHGNDIFIFTVAQEANSTNMVIESIQIYYLAALLIINSIQSSPGSTKRPALLSLGSRLKLVLYLFPAFRGHLSSLVHGTFNVLSKLFIDCTHTLHLFDYNQKMSYIFKDSYD